MDRQHRRDLKHDKFVDEVGNLSNRAVENQRLLLLITAGAVVIAILAYGIYFYRSNREEKAQAALAVAIETIDSPLIPAPGAQQQQPVPPNARFKTDGERAGAAEKQFETVKHDYSGSTAADVADLYLARITGAKGDYANSRKLLEGFINREPSHLLVGGARYSLFQLRIDNGEQDQVIGELNAEILKRDPVLPTDALLELLARAYDHQGNTAKMKETYRRIATEFPDSPYTVEAQRRSGAA